MVVGWSIDHCYNCIAIDCCEGLHCGLWAQRNQTSLTEWITFLFVRKMTPTVTWLIILSLVGLWLVGKSTKLRARKRPSSFYCWRRKTTRKFLPHRDASNQKKRSMASILSNHSEYHQNALNQCICGSFSSIINTMWWSCCTKAADSARNSIHSGSREDGSFQCYYRHETNTNRRRKVVRVHKYTT